MPKLDKSQFTIVVANNEQKPLTDLLNQLGYTATNGTLNTGDYSIEGYENRVAVERKSLDDLVNTLVHSNDRFQRELLRACNFERFAIVVESPAAKLAAGKYYSKATPKHVGKILTTLTWRYRVPVYFTNGRTAAAAHIGRLLHGFVNDCHTDKLPATPPNTGLAQQLTLPVQITPPRNPYPDA